MGLSTYRECAYCATSNNVASLFCASCGAVLLQESVQSSIQPEKIGSQSLYASGLVSQEPLKMQAPPILLADVDAETYGAAFDEAPVGFTGGGMQQQQQVHQKVSSRPSPKRGPLSRRKVLFGLIGGAFAGGWLVAYEWSRPAPVAMPIPSVAVLIPTPLKSDSGLLPAQNFSLAWSPDGRYLGLSNEGSSTLQILDGATHSVLVDASVAVRGVDDASTVINDLGWSPINSNVFACACDDGTVEIRQMPHATVAQLYREHLSPVLALSWRPDSKYIASVDQTSVLQIWDATSLNTLTHYDSIFIAPVTSLAWSPDGKLLACGCADGKVLLVDSNKEAPVLTYAHNGQAIEALAWSPDGRYLASASDDGSVLVCLPQTGEPVSSFYGPTNKVWCLAWSPDSQFLASGSWDKSVSIWKLGEKKPFRQFVLGQDLVVALAWSKQSHLVSIDASGTLHFLSLAL